MVYYIESYNEYLEFEKRIKRSLDFLSPPDFPRNLLRGYEKFAILIFQTYLFICSVLPMIYTEQNVITFVISIMTIAGDVQFVAKSLSILCNTDGLNTIFLFIREMYQVDYIEVIDFTTHHLKRILRINKLLSV